MDGMQARFAAFSREIIPPSAPVISCWCVTQRGAVAGCRPCTNKQNLPATRLYPTQFNQTFFDSGLFWVSVRLRFQVKNWKQAMRPLHGLRPGITHTEGIGVSDSCHPLILKVGFKNGKIFASTFLLKSTIAWPVFSSSPH